MGDGCCCSSSCKDNELCDYTLNHKDPNLFDRSQVSSPMCVKWNTIIRHKDTIYQIKNWKTLKLFFIQWCPEGRVSIWYVIYRVVWALLFVGLMTGYWINCGTGSKWLIFMTDLGFMFLTLHYVIDAILVVCRFTWERCNPDETCE